jgi:hypothetical protein
MKKVFSVTALLLVSAQLFFSCRSTRPADAIPSVASQTQVALNSCEQTIKYISGKAIDPGTQTAIDLSIEVIIDPTEKLITLNLESPQKGKGTLKANVLSSDCYLNAGLTDGYSVYRALGQDPDGPSPEVSFRVEAKEDGLTIFYTDDKKKGELIIKVNKWEIVKQ